MDSPTFYYARGVKPQDNYPAPYGGVLMQSFMTLSERTQLAQRLHSLPQLAISASELLDLELIAAGALSPLTGFMTQAEYAGVLERVALPDGQPWGLPVTLAVTREAALSIRSGQEAALYHDRQLVGVMLVEEIFPWSPEIETRALDGAQDMLRLQERQARQASYLVGGPVALLAARAAEFMQPGHCWPQEQRARFGQYGWKQVAVAHVKLPWLRTHEYLLKCALEASDGLLLHASQEHDPFPRTVPDTVLAAASRQLVENYFPVHRVMENPLPASLLVPHPRAALTHAIVSQNYGATRLIVPETFEMTGMEVLLNKAARFGLSIQVQSMPPAFHCEACGGIATEKSCPHGEAGRVRVSEADVLQQLQSGAPLSPLFARAEIARSITRGLAAQPGAKALNTERHIHPYTPEVSRELRQAIIGHKPCVLWMTGLSGSGKSTIAHRLERDLLVSGHRVFVLDGDTLRHGLNRDLGFSPAERRENLRRAAEVAKAMTEAGMIVIASLISPFRAERDTVREILGGHFHEIFVDARLETCEERDPKGLYKRARAGEIPEFTGISSPYEPPRQPVLTLDTTLYSVEDCVQRLREYLAQHNLLRAGSPHATGDGAGVGPIRLQS